MLVVSIHDVAPRNLEAVQRLRDHLDRWGADRVTLLTVPHYHGEDFLPRSPQAVRWLKERADGGDEVALHGYYHRERRTVRRPIRRLKSRLLGGRQAEMLSMNDGEQRRVLERGKILVEDLLGREVRGFVAPSWLETGGLGRTLSEAGFSWHETSLCLEKLPRGRRLRAPVIAFGSGGRASRLASVLLTRGLEPVADAAATLGLAPVRIALHPGDLDSPAVMRSVEGLVRRLSDRHFALTASEALER